MKEQQIQSYFMRKCRENDIYAVKLIATSKRGVADVMVIHNGVIFVEFKTPIGKQSDAQKIFECTCLLNGVRYIVIRYKVECDEFIKQLLNK